jgi:hypothetical protein
MIRDSGTPPDTAPLDSGMIQDSGTPPDTAPLDSGMIQDSGTPPDTAPPDTGTIQDTGTFPLDTGSMDTGSIDSGGPMLTDSLSPVDVLSPESGDGGCFPATTPVVMADGSSKRIEEVRAGDVVLSYDASRGALVPARVVEVRRHGRISSVAGLVRINGTLLSTRDHPFYVDGAMTRADELRVGTPVIHMSERSRVERRPLESVEIVDGDVETYDLVLTGARPYFVDGTLVWVKMMML